MNTINLWIKRILLLVVAAFFVLSAPQALAWYNPGETLNPPCGPSTSGCDVYSAVYATSTIPTGSILYTSATSTWTTLPIGTDGKVLKVSSGGLVWGNDSGGTSYTASEQGLHLDSGTNVFSIALDGSTLSQSGSGLRISSSYPGQASITTLGTITTGTWQATPVAVAYGGTGASSTPTNGQLLIGNGSGYSVANPTGSGGIAITNGAGTLDIGLNINGLSAITGMDNEDYFAVYATSTASNKKISFNSLANIWGGSLNYRGSWNASVNNPDITTGDTCQTAQKGYYYVVSASSTTTNLDGNSVWNINDWAVCNGTIWDRIQTTNNIASVFGRTGAITATAGDYSADKITNTASSTLGISSTNVQNAINELASEKEGTITAGTSAQYWRGDKTWATLDTATVTENALNLYFTNARARSAISSNVTGISYATSTGVIALTSGYTIPLVGSSAGDVMYWDNNSNLWRATNLLSLATSTSIATINGRLNTTNLNVSSNATTTALAVTTNGITLASSTPASTSNNLYNLGGALYWNGTNMSAGSSKWSLSGSDIYRTAGNVMVGTTTPLALLTVDGTGNVTGAFTIGGNFNLSGNANVTGDLAINTNKFTVASSTGNTAIAGTLNVTGASTFATTTATGLTLSTNGLTIASSTPAVATNTIYNNAGTLFWSGDRLSGLSTLNGLASSTQTFAVGTSGTDFNISSSGATHTFNIPDASSTARGFVSTSTQTIAGAKTFTSGLMVDGSTAGDIQLLVQGAPSQTANLFVIENSGGTDIFSMDSSGKATLKPASNVGPMLFDGGNVTSNGLLELKSYDRQNKSAGKGIFTISGNATTLTGALTGQVIDMTPVNTGTSNTQQGLLVTMNNAGSGNSIGVDIQGASGANTVDTGLKITNASTAISFADATSTIAIANTGELSFTDGTNTLLRLTDSGTSGDLTVTGGLTVNGASTLATTTATTLTVSENSTFATSTISALTVTGTSTLAGITASGILPVSTIDNSADAFDLQEGINNYINISTLNGSEAITFGNGTTSPDFIFTSTGATGGDGTQLALNDLNTSNSYSGTLLKRNGTDRWFIGLNGSNANDDYVIRRNNSVVSLLVRRSDGNVGIGDTTPNALLTVGSGDLFQVDSLGNLTVSGSSSLATSTATGLTLSTNGLTIASSTPSATTNTLYNQGGSLYWNGSALGSGSVSNGSTVGQMLAWDGSAWAPAANISFATSTGLLTVTGITATNATTTGLTALGSTSLATTTATALTVSGNSTFATSTISALTVTGTSTLAGISGTGLVVTGNATLATTTAAGLTLSTNGLTLASSTPATTASTLYAQGSALYWNGSQLGAGLPSGTSGQTITYDASNNATSTSVLKIDLTNSRVGIGLGASSPTNALTLAAGKTIDSLGALSITTAANGALSLTSNGTGAVTLDSGTTGAINIGTGAYAKTVTIGNTTGASSLALNAGTGDIQIGYISNSPVRIGNNSGTGLVSIYSGTTAALTLDSGTTGAINIGTGANAKTITIGNATSTTSVVINAGTGNLDLKSGGTTRVNITSGDTYIFGGVPNNSFIDLYGGVQNMRAANYFIWNGTSTERMRLDTASGELLIGTSTPQNSPLVIKAFNANSVNAAGVEIISNLNTNVRAMHAVYSDGAIITTTNNNWTSNTQAFFAAGATAWSFISDERLKSNILTLDNKTNLEKVLALRPVEFDWKNGDGHQVGFVAQEVQKVMPVVVYSANDGMLGIGKEAMIPFVVGAIQEQQGQIASTTAAIAEIKTQLALAQTSGTGNVSVSSLNQLAISGALAVDGHITLGKDTVGEAVIPAGQTSVAVTFETPYAEKPAITITPSEAVLFKVTGKTANGFTITLPSAQSTDVVFDWHAFAQKGKPFDVSAGDLAEAGGAQPAQQIQQIEELGGGGVENSNQSVSSEPSETSETLDLAPAPSEPASKPEPESEPAVVEPAPADLPAEAPAQAGQPTESAPVEPATAEPVIVEPAPAPVEPAPALEPAVVGSEPTPVVDGTANQ